MPVGLHLIVITLFDLLWDGKANYSLSLQNIPGHGGRIRPQVSNRDIDRSSRAVCETQITSMNHFLAQPSAALRHIQLKLKLKYSIKDSGYMNVTFKKIILNMLLLYAKGWCLQGVLRCFVVFIDSFGLRFPKTSKDQFDSDSMKNYNNAVHKYATLLYSADSLCWDIMQMNSNFKSSF